MRRKGIWLLSAVLCLLLAFSAAPAFAADDGPEPLPHSFYGTVTIGSSPAPVPTVITAKVAGEECGSYTTTVEGLYGSSDSLQGDYLVVQGYIDNGATIDFFVGGVEADQKANFHSGTYTELDLTVGEVDNPPTVVISSIASDPTNISPIPVTATFSENVTGFELGDISVGNGAADNFAGSGADYTFDVTPTADGEVTVDIAAGVAEDADTNPNEAATQFSITYDSTAPTATLSPVNTAIDVAIGATVTATFDENVTEVDLSGITITGAIGVSATLAANIITIAHDAFALDTVYTVTIPAEAVEDLAGNPSAEISWSFTTAEVEVTYYTLTMAVTGSGATEPAVGEHSYQADEVVSITATPASGWEFSAWSTADMTEIGSASSASTTVTVDKDKTVTATFTEGEVFDPYVYDTDGVEGFSKAETLAAVSDYLAGTITKVDALEVVKLYFS